MALHYDPLALADDPYPTYRALRREAPLFHGETAGREFWALARHDDIWTAVEDWRTFSSRFGNDLDDTGDLFGAEPAMDLCDPPVHTRQRDVLRRVMAPSTINARLGHHVAAKVDTLLAELRDAEEEIDIAATLAYRLPMETICGWLGYPASDFAQLRRWHEDMLSRTPGSAELPPHAISARDAMWDYIRDQLARRRARPSDDLLSILAEAQAAGQLSDGEALANAVFLFDAGIVSTSALISSALLQLATFPDQKRLLWGDAGLIGAAIEEFLRFDPPFQWFTRVTTRPVAYYRQMVPEGARVVLIWASGNRDERVWPDGEVLRLDRPRERHFSFGGGIHTCIGIPLARLEMRLLLQALIGRLADYEIAGDVERRITPSERTISHLRIRPRWRG